jgi:hypothetical protein
MHKSPIHPSFPVQTDWLNGNWICMPHSYRDLERKGIRGPWTATSSEICHLEPRVRRHRIGPVLVGEPNSTTASPASTLVAAAAPHHDRAAFCAQWCVRCHGEQVLLRIASRRPQKRGFPGLRDRIFRSQEFGSQPSENVVQNRFLIGDLRIPHPTTRLESNVSELVHQES